MMKEHYARQVEQCCRHEICVRYPAILPVLSDFLDLLKIDEVPMLVRASPFIPSGPTTTPRSSEY
jgi:hypothetical protein